MVKSIFILAILISSHGIYSQNRVFNNTGIEIDSVLIHKFLNMHGIENINLYINYHKLNISHSSNFDIDYFVTKVTDSKYVLFVNHNTKLINLKKLIHELFHVKQYYHKELIIIDKYNVWYKGESINTRDIPYKKRKYENIIFKIKDYK